MINRRDFIKVAGLAVFAPQILASSHSEANWDRVLVLLELKGGNDGLNTVVPYTDERYYQLRPQLAVRREQVLQLSDKLGLNPVLKNLMSSWKDKDLAIVNGVGYPKPNRSHFRSIEIWETGSDSDDYLQDGWIARLFAKDAPPKDFVADGIILGRDDFGPLQGTNMRNITMRNPKKFFKQAKRIREISKTTDNESLLHLFRVQSDLHKAVKSLEEKMQKLPQLSTSFPGTPIGKQMAIAANLIRTKMPVAVIKVSHGGFDTHSNQRGQHDRLLTQLSTSLAAFRSSMKEAGLWDKVMVMSYSEFGRRAYENGSKGTDHGTAAPHFLMGGKVKGGMYGEQPSLTDLLSKGDLRHVIDYRSLYATVASKWWGIPSDFSQYSLIDCI